MSENVTKELELLRREKDLVERKLVLMQRENEALGNTSHTAHNRPSLSIKAIGDLVGEFDGTEYTYLVWEKQIRLLRDTYNLDGNMTKVLIEMKLRGKALKWLHSNAEHIDLDCEELLKKNLKTCLITG